MTQSMGSYWRFSTATTIVSMHLCTSSVVGIYYGQITPDGKEDELKRIIPNPAALAPGATCCAG